MVPTTEQFLLFCKLVSLGRDCECSNGNFNRSLRKLEGSKNILTILENIYDKNEVEFSLSFLDKEFYGHLPLHIKQYLVLNGRELPAEEFAEFKACLLIFKKSGFFKKYLEYIKKSSKVLSIETQESEDIYKIFFKT